jgi:hypothetical protein
MHSQTLTFSCLSVWLVLPSAMRCGSGLKKNSVDGWQIGAVEGNRSHTPERQRLVGEGQPPQPSTPAPSGANSVPPKVESPDKS